MAVSSSVRAFESVLWRSKSYPLCPKSVIRLSHLKSRASRLDRTNFFLRGWFCPLLCRGISRGALKSHDDYHSQVPRFGAEDLPKGLDFVDRTAKLAMQKDVRTSQSMLVQLPVQGASVFLIPSISKSSRLKGVLVLSYAKMRKV